MKAGELGFEARHPPGQPQGNSVARALLQLTCDEPPCHSPPEKMASKWPVLSRFCPDDSNPRQEHLLPAKHATSWSEQCLLGSFTCDTNENLPDGSSGC